MSSNAKELIFEEEARSKLSKGIEEVAKTVSFTLGPKGRNVGLSAAFGSPQITNHGTNIVREIELEDQFENMGASMAHEVASKIKENSGDGTTTGIVLLNALVKEGVKNIASGTSPILLKRGIEKAVDRVISAVKDSAHPVSTKEQIENIATVSASNDTEIGSLIAQAFEKVGNEGVISIEQGKGTETVLETVDGMLFDRGYLSPYFCTNAEKLTCEMTNPQILVTDSKVTSVQELLPLLQTVAAAGQELLIIAEDIEGDPLSTLVVNKIRGSLKVAAVKAPAFGDRRKAMLQDIATLTGATVVSSETGMNLKDATAEVLGSCEKVTITKNDTTIIDGKGDQEALKARIAQIESEIANASSEYDKEKLQERKAKLSGGVALIRVGAPTESEMKKKKQIFEDALSSTRAALENGYVEGGGVALLRAATGLDDADLSDEEKVGFILVKKALEMPCRQIIENSGKEASLYIEEITNAQESVGFNALTGKVEDLLAANIVDPASVVISSLRFAASVACIVLISEALVGDAKEEEAE